MQTKNRIETLILAMPDDRLLVKRVFIDMAGDLITGIALSQIIQWYRPDEQGRTQLIVAEDGQLWLVKKLSDWWDECRVTARQVELATNRLKKQGLIETAVFNFDGNATTHIRINEDVFMASIEKLTRLINEDEVELSSTLSE